MITTILMKIVVCEECVCEEYISVYEENIIAHNYIKMENVHVIYNIKII